MKKSFIFLIVLIMSVILMSCYYNTMQIPEEKSSGISYINNPNYIYSNDNQNNLISEIPTEIIEEKYEKYGYTQEDLDLLARLIYAEAGASWLSDEHQLLVGSVVINLANHPEFPPNTIRDVIYYPGAYPPAYNGLIDNTPDERTYENAKKVLNGEFYCPPNVIFQSEFIQGDGIYKVINDEILGTTYFCYIN